MGKPAAKQGDQVTATDMHLIQPPGSAPTSPVPHLFMGVIDGGLSQNVNIQSKPAATVGSTATNTPAHIPSGGSFVNPPSNRGKIMTGSGTVFINGKPAARAGDQAQTCADPIPNSAAKVVATGTVMIGGREWQEKS